MGNYQNFCERDDRFFGLSDADCAIAVREEIGEPIRWTPARRAVAGACWLVIVSYTTAMLATLAGVIG